MSLQGENEGKCPVVERTFDNFFGCLLLLFTFIRFMRQTATAKYSNNRQMNGEYATTWSLIIHLEKN